MPTPTRARPRQAPRAALLFATCLLAAATLPAGDGDLDPTWGGDGISASLGSSVPRASGVAPDQQLYFTGNTTLPDDSEFEWYRTENSGGGQWSGCSRAVPLLDNFDIREVLFDSSGRLLFAGTTTVFGTETVERAFIARFGSFDDDESCALDSSFSGAGWEYFDDAPFCDTEDCRLIDIEESNDPTTRYVALLESIQNALISQYYLVGLTASGAPDANFGTGGFLQIAALNFGLSYGGGAEIALDPANRIYVLHSYFDPDANFDVDTAISRFLSNGQLDITFETAGTRFLAVVDDEDTAPRALTIANDGLLAFAWYNETTQEGSLQVYRPATAQSVAISFDPLEPRALAFDGLRRLLFVFDYPHLDGMAMNRLLPNFGTGLAGDPAFSFSFLDIDGGGGNADAAVDIETPAGRPMLLFEAEQSGGGSQAYLVRLENSLIFADGFEWGSTKYW